MGIPPHLQKLLEQLPQDQLDFGAIITAIDRTRFSGPVTFDFLNGRAMQISIGQPIRLSICAGVDKPTTGSGGS